MAGLLAFMAAGAAKGAGTGIVAEARAKREAAIAELENARLLSREQTDRDFRSSEAAKTREFQSGESALERAERAEDNRLSRMETMTADDGTTLIREGDRFTQAKMPDGKPVKALATSKDAPADVQSAEWLIANGAASSPEEAWNLVRSAREDKTTAADLETMVEKAVDTELGGSFSPPSADVIEESRQRNRERIMKNLGIGDTKDAKAGASSAQAAPARPEGMTDAQVIQEATASLKRGAPADAVRARLTSMGIDPKKAGI